jgi:hypothetical protein
VGEGTNDEVETSLTWGASRVTVMAPRCTAPGTARWCRDDLRVNAA